MEWEKNKELIRLIMKLMELGERAEQEFREAFSRHLENIHDGTFHFEVDSINALETSADEVVNDIKTELYTSGMPTTSDDLLVLTSRFDSIIDAMTTILVQINTRNTSSSSELIPLYKELLEATTNCTHKTISLTRTFFTNFNKNGIIQSVEDVCQAETAVDTIEDSLIEKLFSTEVSIEKKVAESQLINGLGEIANCCEDLANHVGIVNFKTAE